MNLKIYNTRTRQKEVFIPVKEGEAQPPIGLYVCGPTVYDFAHIGNARPVVVFDVLTRLLRTLYPHVIYVRNITDVDDKINAASAASGEPIEVITQRTAQAYQDDMATLGALLPDVQPRATQHIPEMIKMIQTLIEKGHAYEAAGHVIFDVSSDADYGKLSQRNQEELIAGARVEIAPYKKNPADFVLWKPSDDKTPGWESPWGRGRPGWHIECSAMAEKYLGKTFDIHGGGIDLLFPHHENEIAQSCCAHDTPYFAKYWMHNGHLTVNGEKMSKSLGNFFTVRDLLEKYPGEALRYMLMSTHYRQPLDLTDTLLQQSKHTLDRFYGALRQCDQLQNDLADVLHDGIAQALLDDLNFPLALTHMHEMVGRIYKTQNQQEKNKIGRELIKAGKILGLLQQTPQSWFQGRERLLSVQTIEENIKKRQEFRTSKAFAEADKVREFLLQEGVIIEDTPQGTTWRWM